MGKAVKEPLTQRDDTPNVYTFNTSNVWIEDRDHDIWIVSGDTGISICVFDHNTDEILDASYIRRKKNG